MSELAVVFVAFDGVQPINVVSTTARRVGAFA